MNRILAPIDRLLNGITMYRLVVYGLAALLAAGFAVSLSGNFFFTPGQLALSVLLLAASCYAANVGLARLYGVAANAESWLITALILACILPAPTTPVTGLVSVAAGVIAMLSKYALASGRRHWGNPAAVSAVALGLLGLTYADWWVGNASLFPLTAVLTLAVLWKLKKWQLAGAFLLPALLVSLAQSLVAGYGTAEALRNFFVSGPAIFFAGIMLTEPLTMPSGSKPQLAYAALIGALFSSHWSLGPFSGNPEQALLIGNLAFAWMAAPRPRLGFKALERLGGTAYELVLETDRPLRFVPGQYLELTAPHAGTDDRGNRRTFTIASAPGTAELRFGIRIPEQAASSFKRALLQAGPRSQFGIGAVGGSFTLPDDPSEKLLFLAGGIGITPFASMAQWLRDRGQSRDIVLVHAVSRREDAVYKESFEGTKRLVLVSDASTIPAGAAVIVGRVTGALLSERIADLGERTVYVSGSPGFVQSCQLQLSTVGVPARRIRTDSFTGY